VFGFGEDLVCSALALGFPGITGTSGNGPKVAVAGMACGDGIDTSLVTSASEASIGSDSEDKPRSRNSTSGSAIANTGESVRTGRT
jgi:hypothetical protein